MHVYTSAYAHQSDVGIEDWIDSMEGTAIYAPVDGFFVGEGFMEGKTSDLRAHRLFVG